MIETSPNPVLYQIGKGIMEIAEWVGGVPGAYTDVGNCPLFSVTVTEEKIPHFNQRTNVRLKDRNITIESGYTAEFDLDEISVLNLKMFLRATVASGHILHANQALDKEYAIRFTSDNAAGRNERWNLWKATLSPRGPFNLISDEWSMLEFAVEGLADLVNHVASPYFDVTFVTTTSTTTTS